jgi:hypothetical protein
MPENNEIRDVNRILLDEDIVLTNKSGSCDNMVRLFPALPEELWLL